MNNSEFDGIAYGEANATTNIYSSTDTSGEAIRLVSKGEEVVIDLDRSIEKLYLIMIENGKEGFVSKECVDLI